MNVTVCILHLIFSKSGGYFLLKACLNSEAKFLLEIMDLRSDFRKCIIDKVGSCIHAIQTHLSVFLIITFVPVFNFKFKFKLRKTK